MMDKIWYGLQVTVVGILVVFFGLVILIVCIRALKAIKAKDAGGAKETQPVMTLEPAPQQLAAELPVRVYTPGPPLTKRDDAFFAVVTAAIAATLESEGINPEGGFAIRSVKAIDSKA